MLVTLIEVRNSCRVLPALFLWVLIVTPCRAGGLTLEIDGFESADGMARLLLFDSEASYQGSEPPYYVVSVQINDARAIWVGDDVSSGEYAAIVYHDKDSNDKLNRPYFSLPLEPYGYSNGATKAIGLPPFEAVAFEIGIERSHQHITVFYNPFARAVLFIDPFGNIALLALSALLLIFAFAWSQRWRGE